jgi:AAHS family cis,cis-muconate transporter-like MFS transporter
MAAVQKVAQMQNGTLAPVQDRMWKLVFAFAFLGLLVDGADLMFLSFSLSSLKTEFGLTNVQAGSLGSITLAGMVVGGLVSGWAADRFGRVRTVVWTIIVFSVATAALGFTHSYAQFAVARFIAALGLGAEYIVCNTMMSEYVPTKYRTTVLATVQSAWSVGYIVAALLSNLILPTYGWRWLFIIGIVPVVMAVAMQRHVKESPAWLASDARRRASLGLSAAQRAAGKRAAKPASGLRKIFADPVQRKMFLLWAISSSMLQFGYFGVNNWMPTYLEKELHISFASMTGYMVCNYVAMIAGKVIAGWLADRLGRRLVFAAGSIGTALFLPLIVYYHTPDLILPMLVFFGFLYGIPYGVNATYMTESFPTDVRGTAVGGSYNIGRIGAAFAPAVIGYLATGGSIGLGFVVMGVAYFMAGVIPGLFIKEKQFDPLQ